MTTTQDARGEIVLALPSSIDAVHLARAFVRSVIRFDTDEDDSGYAIAVTEVFSDMVARHRQANANDTIALRIRLVPRAVVTIVGRDPIDSTFCDLAAEAGGLRIARAFVPDLAIRRSATSRLVELPLPSAAAAVPAG